MKQKNKLSKTNQNNISSQTTSLRDVANYVADETDKHISDGTSKTTASNGKPMNELKGAPVLTATLKNIGRAAKPDGGMKDGLETIMLNTKAKAVIETLDFSEKQPSDTNKIPTSKVKKLNQK